MNFKFFKLFFKNLSITVRLAQLQLSILTKIFYFKGELTHILFKLTNLNF